MSSYFLLKKKVLELQEIQIPPHCTQFGIIMQRLNLSLCFMSFFFFPQEISRTYFRTCLKDHAGVDGQRDNLEVHFVVIGGDECKRDNLMIIFLNFIVVVPLSLVLLFSRALEQGNQTWCTYKNDYLSVSWQHTKGPLISILLGLRFKLNYYRSLWVGACNSTIFLSRRFHRPIYF